MLRDQKGLEKATEMQMLSLVALAHDKTPHKLLHHRSHERDVKIVTQSVKCLLNTLMTEVMGICQACKEAK